MKNLNIWTQAALLIAGILAGFLIGRISFQAEAPAKQPVTGQTAATVNTQAVSQQETIIKPRILETVNGVSADNAPYIGPADAPLTVIEFTDFQCPYCRKYYLESYNRIKENYADKQKVKYAFRNFPLEEHPQAMTAAMAAECANEQGKFWEMHDRLFTDQDKWSYQDNANDIFKGFAKDLKLDENKFNTCLDGNKYQQQINKDITDGETYNVTSTPTFFIGNKKVVGAQPYDTFTSVIEGELKRLWQTQQM